MIEKKHDLFFSNSLPRLIFFCSLLFACCAFLIGWNGSLSDLYGFRQAQTAITVDYMLKGGPWLAYETPVLGPPWSIPMEFPLYQWLVALTTKTGVSPLDQAGRFVSIIFFLSTLYPLCKILGLLKFTRGQVFLVLSLYCFSPEYLFWSRTFMIESLALALSLHYLWLVIIYAGNLERCQWKWGTALAIGVVGALAAMVKITTFFAFAVLGGGIIGWSCVRAASERGLWCRATLLPLLQAILCAMLIPVVALLLWTSYCDSLKSLNPLARDFLLSSTLKEWNFGTLVQKLSLQTWEIFFVRLTDLSGSSWLVVVTIIAGVLCRKARYAIAILCLALFTLVFATFTNLHLVHTYYQYSNGLFLIVAIGIICSELWTANDYLRKILGFSIFCLIAICSVSHYVERYMPLQGQTINIAPITNNMKKFMQHDDIIVIFGHDWSSELPYYLDRRAVMIRSDQESLTTPAFQEMKRNIAGYKVGAILFCGKTQKDSALIRRALTTFDFDRSFRSKNGDFITIYYRGL